MRLGDQRAIPFKILSPQMKLNKAVYYTAYTPFSLSWDVVVTFVLMGEGGDRVGTKHNTLTCNSFHLFYVILCHIMSHMTWYVSCNVILYHAIFPALCHIWYVMSCHTYFMSCHIISWPRYHVISCHIIHHAMCHTYVTNYVWHVMYHLSCIMSYHASYYVSCVVFTYHVSYAMSCVTCHVTCHVSHVMSCFTCHISDIYSFMHWILIYALNVTVKDYFLFYWVLTFTSSWSFMNWFKC